jgi:hypothetical protein
MGAATMTSYGQSAGTAPTRSAETTSLDARVSSNGQAETAESKMDVYNAGSLIFDDSRTPRYPLLASEQENIANYNRAKQVWIQNNPQIYSEMNRTPEPTEEQLRQRREATGK